MIEPIDPYKQLRQVSDGVVGIKCLSVMFLISLLIYCVVKTFGSKKAWWIPSLKETLAIEVIIAKPFTA